MSDDMAHVNNLLKTSFELMHQLRLTKEGSYKTKEYGKYKTPIGANLGAVLVAYGIVKNSDDAQEMGKNIFQMHIYNEEEKPLPQGVDRASVLNAYKKLQKMNLML